MLKFQSVFTLILPSLLIFSYIILLKSKQTQNNLVNEKNLCLKEQFDEQYKSCQNLTEFDKGTLSFKMMNCHYQRAGRITINCDFQDFQKCTSKLDSNYWNIFTQFYILIQHLCQIQILTYLQSNVDKNLLQILNDQQFINENLNNQLQKMRDILYSQNEIQNNTNFLMTYIQQQYQNIDQQRENEAEKQSYLIEQINSMNLQINQYHNEIETSFQELSFYFQIIKYYVNLIYCQEQKINQILFYLIDLLILWILTSNKFLQEQRFSGFILLLISLLLEQFQFQYSREALIINQLLLLIFGYFNFKDYEQLTYYKLRSIESRMAYFDLSNFKKKAKELLQTTAKKLKFND